MDNWALSFILSRWEEFGLKRKVERKGRMVCKDCCIQSLGEHPRRVTGWSTRKEQHGMADGCGIWKGHVRHELCGGVHGADHLPGRGKATGRLVFALFVSGE